MERLSIPVSIVRAGAFGDINHFQFSVSQATYGKQQVSRVIISHFSVGGEECGEDKGQGACRVGRLPGGRHVSLAWGAPGGDQIGG